jgi:hypothetical protein
MIDPALSPKHEPVEDAIMQEIRQYREAYAAKFNNDLHAMVEDMRRRQASSGKPAIDLSQLPQPPYETVMQFTKKA